MTFKPRYAPEFRREIDRAVDYLQYEKGNPSAAHALVDEFDRAIETVLLFPNAMPVWMDSEQTELKYRSVKVKNYLAFYVVDGDTIEFRRFLLAFSDLKSQLLQ